MNNISGLPISLDLIMDNFRRLIRDIVSGRAAMFSFGGAEPTETGTQVR